MKDFLHYMSLRYWNDHDARASGYRFSVCVSWAMFAVAFFCFAMALTALTR